jgi:hypothetical protein
MQEHLHPFEAEDWKKLEAQYRQCYAATYCFVTENKGSVQESRDVYMEAFLQYTQLLELRGMKLIEKGPDVVYSFSRRLWLHKLEKRLVDLNYVKHRREYFEMEEAFDAITSINERSAKTADKLAVVGEPHRTLILECVGRRKAIQDVAPRFGFSNEERAFVQMAKALRKLVTLTEGKEPSCSEQQWIELLRYVLDHPDLREAQAMEAHKVDLTLLSRTIALIRAHITRGERTILLRKMQELTLEPEQESTSGTETNKHAMKPVVVFSLAACIAVCLSAVTSLGILGVMPAVGNHLAEAEVLRDTTAVEEVTEVRATVPPPTFTATATALTPDGYFITSARALDGAKSIRLVHPELNDFYKAELVIADTAMNLALVRCVDAHRGFSVPFRLAPDPVALGENVYMLSYTNQLVTYTDGSVSFTQGSERLGARLGHTSPGAPLMLHNGQLAGIATHLDGENTHVAGIAQVQDLVARAQTITESKLAVPLRNGLYFYTRTQQVHAMKPSVYRVKVYYE